MGYLPVVKIKKFLSNSPCRKTPRAKNQPNWKTFWKFDFFTPWGTMNVSSGNKSVPTFIFRSFLILGDFRLWGTRIRWNYQVLTSGGTSTGGGRWVKTSKIQVCFMMLRSKLWKRSFSGLLEINSHISEILVLANQRRLKFCGSDIQDAAKVLGQNNSRKNDIISKIFSNKSFYLRVSSKKNNFILTNAQIDHLLPRYRRRDVS